MSSTQLANAAANQNSRQTFMVKKSAEKNVEAQRKNRIEMQRFRTLQTHIDRQKVWSGVLIQREKDDVRANMTRMRGTSGYSSDGLPLEGPEDLDYETSSYSQNASRVSEKKLVKWRQTEKELKRTIFSSEGLRLLRPPWEATDEGKAMETLVNLMTLLGYEEKEVTSLIRKLWAPSSAGKQRDYQDDEASVSSVTTDDRREATRNKERIDVFQSLRDDINTQKDVTKKPVGHNKNEPKFSVQEWEKEFIGKYINEIAASPVKISKKERLMSIRNAFLASHSHVDSSQLSEWPPSGLRASGGRKPLPGRRPTTAPTAPQARKPPTGRQSHSANQRSPHPITRSNTTMSTHHQRPLGSSGNADSSANAESEAVASKTFTQGVHSVGIEANTTADSSSLRSVPDVTDSDQTDANTAEQERTTRERRTGVIVRPEKFSGRISQVGFQLPHPGTSKKGVGAPDLPSIDESSSESNPESQGNNTSSTSSKPDRYSSSGYNPLLEKEKQQAASIPKEKGPSADPEVAAIQGRIAQWRRDLLMEAPPGFANKESASQHLLISRSQRHKDLGKLVEENERDIGKSIRREQFRKMQSRLKVFLTMTRLHKAATKTEDEEPQPKKLRTRVSVIMHLIKLKNMAKEHTGSSQDLRRGSTDPRSARTSTESVKVDERIGRFSKDPLPDFKTTRRSSSFPDEKMVSARPPSASRLEVLRRTRSPDEPVGRMRPSSAPLTEHIKIAK